MYKYYSLKGWLPKNGNDTIEPWDYAANERKICQELVKNHMAKVSVMFDRKKYVRTLTNIKVTFTDKLAAFGELF